MYIINIKRNKKAVDYAHNLHDKREYAVHCSINSKTALLIYSGLFIFGNLNYLELPIYVTISFLWTSLKQYPKVLPQLL